MSLRSYQSQQRRALSERLVRLRSRVDEIEAKMSDQKPIRRNTSERYYHGLVLRVRVDAGYSRHSSDSSRHAAVGPKYVISETASRRRRDGVVLRAQYFTCCRAYKVKLLARDTCHRRVIIGIRRKLLSYEALDPVASNRAAVQKRRHSRTLTRYAAPRCAPSATRLKS
jgi:hypothetical protein